MQYLGIDWAYRRVAWCARSDGGAITGEGVVPADEDGLIRLVLAHGIDVKACVEMMSGAVWVRDRLPAAGWRVQVAHARKVRDVAPLACKTDKVDARVLAELCRRDLVPRSPPPPQPPHVPPPSRCAGGRPPGRQGRRDRGRPASHAARRRRRARRPSRRRTPGRRRRRAQSPPHDARRPRAPARLRQPAPSGGLTSGRVPARGRTHLRTPAAQRSLCRSRGSNRRRLGDGTALTHETLAPPTSTRWQGPGTLAEALPTPSEPRATDPCQTRLVDHTPPSRAREERAPRNSTRPRTLAIAVVGARAIRATYSRLRPLRPPRTARTNLGLQSGGRRRIVSAAIRTGHERSSGALRDERGLAVVPAQ
jgi:hypothetical protein